MALDDQLEQMQSFVVTQLKSTGRFAQVELKPKYGIPELDYLKKRNIRVETPEGEKYLIVCSADVMPIRNAITQAVAAADHNISLLHILTRSTDAERSFFRREKLEEEYGKGKEQKGYHKKTLSHYSKEERESFRKLREFELLVDLLSPDGVHYYQHPSARLDEGIRKYKFNTVTAQGENDFGQIEHRPLVYWKAPVEMEYVQDCTLAPSGIPSRGDINMRLDEIGERARIPPGRPLRSAQIISSAISADAYANIQDLQKRKRDYDWEERAVIQYYDGLLREEQKIFTVLYAQLQLLENQGFLPK